MNMFARFILIAACAASLLTAASCTKNATKDGGTDPSDVSLDATDIENRFLTEGFITDDLYRVVIVSTKDASQDLGALRTKASNRARVSLERSLAAENIPCDRNVKTAVLNLIDRSGQLVKKDIDNKRYIVYYFDITKNNIKGYFRNIASQR